MTANSFLEYFLVLFGWVLNNALWNILTSTGLFALPLVFKAMGIWLKVREEGADEGNKGVFGGAAHRECVVCRLLRHVVLLHSFDTGGYHDHQVR